MLLGQMPGALLMQRKVQSENGCKIKTDCFFSYQIDTLVGQVRILRTLNKRVIEISFGYHGN